MLRTIPPLHSLSLLEFLAPSIICRSRQFSSTSTHKASSTSRTRSDAVLQHRKIRDQIMEQVHNRPIMPDSLKLAHNKYLADIRKAVEDQDLVKALKLWNQPKKERDGSSYEGLYRVPEYTERKLSNLFSIHLRTLSKEPSADIHTIAQDFALSAAAHDISDALYILMLDHIEHNRPQVAIDLYASYQKSIAKQVVEDLKPTGSDTGLVFSSGEDEAFNPGRVSMLLAAITAYAMKDSFHDALNAYLTANIRPPTYRKLQLIQFLEHDKELKATVERYLHQLGVASIVSRPTSLSKHIMNISSPRSTKMLQELYNNVIDGISGPTPYLAIDASYVSPTKPVAMTEAGWTAFQTGFLQSERPDLAAKIWTDMDKCGFSPGVSMWTSLIDTYANLRDSRQAMKTWNMMLESGAKPDALSYRAIITALFDDKNTELALQKFKEYHRSTKDKTGHAILVYNTVLRGLLRLNRFEDADTLMKVMQDKGPKPDVVSYNTFLAYYSRQRDFKGLSKVIAQMSAVDISGDVVTFSTILTALLNAGREDADTTIINLMRKQGIQPNVATYSAIIDHQMRQETEKSLSAALNILDKMEQDENTMPNEVTYTSILAGVYRNKGISRPRAEAIKADILSRMKRANLVFKMPTYHILIRAALDSQEPKGYLDAISLLDDMERQGLPRTNTVWYILFAGLMHREQWDVAKVMVEKMEDSGHQPTPRLQRLVDAIKQK